jgi:hypothetical protein
VVIAVKDLRHNTIHLCFRLLIALACLVALAANAPLYAKVLVDVKLTSTTMRVSDRNQFEIHVVADEGETITGPKLPSLQAFSLLSRGQSTSRSMDLNTGRSTQEVKYFFDIIALQDGNYTLEGFGAATSKGDFMARPLSITVLPPGAPTPTPSQNVNQQPQNRFGIVFVGEANKNEVYVGEEILLTYTLFKPVDQQIGQIQLTKDEQGRFQNFWTEMIQLDDKYSNNVRLSNGAIYRKNPLIRYIVYPITPGEHTISPMRIVCKLPERSRNNSFFSIPFSRFLDVPLSSDEIPITVKPLPEQGKPVDFKGAVGQFTLSADVDATTINETDTVSLNVVLEGTGNLKNAPPPVMPDLTNFVSYDPVKQQNVDVTVDGMQGRIEYTYVLSPHDINANTIGSVRYPYFDTQNQQYIMLETKPIALTITPSQARLTGGARSIHRRMITMRGEDFRFNAVSLDTIATIHLGVYRHIGLWLLFISPLVLLAAVIAWKQRDDFYTLNPDKRKSRNAPKLAQKLLAEANQTFQNGETDKVYTQLSKAINDYISNRWDVACAGLTTQELSALLAAHKVPDTTISELITLLNEFDSLRFSGAGSQSQKIQENIKTTELLLASLMNHKE